EKEGGKTSSQTIDPPTLSGVDSPSHGPPALCDIHDGQTLLPVDESTTLLSQAYSISTRWNCHRRKPNRTFSPQLSPSHFSPPSAVLFTPFQQANFFSQLIRLGLDLKTLVVTIRAKAGASKTQWRRAAPGSNAAPPSISPLPLLRVVFDETAGGMCMFAMLAFSLPFLPC
ncbi:hypothetical protein CP532_6751, partial [Ophiocordyceps camponoti-leonardi (nom. inval.)]